ncbi:MAG: exodeoxyribonuclease X [Candidatus Paceibacteria bacterium]|jgi:exodeoxyribonuclease X
MDKNSKILIFIDTETTGNLPEDKIIQVAYRTTDDSSDVNELFSPGMPIKIGAMAVHHMTEKMLEGKPVFQGSPTYTDLESRFSNGEIFIAHNAKFDVGMVEKEGLTVGPVIDTLKIARFLDPQGKIESYAMQYLRYFLGIEIEAVAHDAFGDILVLEQLFWRLLKKIMEKENISSDLAVDAMVDISSRPSMIHFFQFGKHKNSSLEEVSKKDRGYLEWLLKQKLADDQRDEDWVYTLEHWLGK